MLLSPSGSSSRSAAALPTLINHHALHLQLCTAESQPFPDLGFIAFTCHAAFSEVVVVKMYVSFFLFFV